MMPVDKREPFMRATLTAALALIAGACAATNPGSGHPRPLRGAGSPAEAIAASTPADWEEISAEDLVVMDLGDGGRVIILLAPDFAPVHVANIRALARSGWWSRATLYRVVENYVAQWGNNEAPPAHLAGLVQRPPAEYDRTLGGLEVRALPYPDPYASQVGHAAGWPVALDRRLRRAWLPHCFGTVAVARDLAPDTGTGAELYAVIGHAPRHLDRNVANVGRVIEGISLLSARARGTGPQGMYQPERGETPIPIASIRIASDLPEPDRPRFERMRTGGRAFAQYIRALANRSDEFFTEPAGGVDICSARVPVRRRGG